MSHTQLLHIPPVYVCLSCLHLVSLGIHYLQFSSHHDIWTVITEVNLACFVVSVNRLHRWPEALIGIEYNIWKCVSSYSVFGGASNNGKIAPCYPLWRHLCYMSCYQVPRVKIDKMLNFLSRGMETLRRKSLMLINVPKADICSALITPNWVPRD